MALQSYVSAEWVTDEALGIRIIKAIGDDGSIWSIPSVDSDVPPWPRFIEEHGVDAITEADMTNQNITSAPDTLFGGPTIAQVLGET